MHKMDTSKIIGIQFSVLSPEEIRKNSVAEITSRDTYINNKPQPGGLFDPRMGVLEPGYICPTDGYTYIDSPGYFGHIELGRPVFFIQHIKEIMKICKCVCLKCSKLLLNKERHKHILDYSESARWSYVTNNVSKIKRCGDSNGEGCGCKCPDKIKLEGLANIIAYWDKLDDGAGEEQKVEMRLTPEIIIKIFKRMSDDDIHFMGFSPVWSRPEWFVCQVLPIAPPAMRPSVKHDAQQRSEDDLTHIYSNIIRENNTLKDKLAAGETNPNVIEGLRNVIQYFIAMIVNNKVKGSAPMQQRSGRPLQCIMDRLNSKYGRIRGNLMGKRVDFSARSVITGDPNLSIRELGVPMKIAMNITKPVCVNERNIKFLTALIQNGPDKYPGAKILERKNGDNVSLRYMDRESIRLDLGDVVHRHMMDGDGVLFNRQPSLHRMSMMCHIVRVMKKGDTFRMNVGDTKPYNADFDGDEMNMHMPQNIMAETELKQLAAIPYQIVSPASNAPIIGIFQDSMLGSYQFTRSNIKFTKKEAMNLLMYYKNVDVKKLFESGKNEVSSFEILSQILPPLTLKYATKLWQDDEDDFATSNNVMEIHNGKYIRGQMEKSVLGGATFGIIHRIFNDYGNLRAMQFIDDLQNVVTEYMTNSSYSVGISDLIADTTTQDSIIQVVTGQKQQVQSLIDQLHLGTFDNSTAKTNMLEFEMQVQNILNKATEQAGKIGRKSLDQDNRFLKIVESGSKGSLINISQMISCLGQTSVEGKRVPYGYENRTLPHFNKYDDSPGARGFIENSYISGLTAPELFFHAMGGRIGLIDTAVKTSQTGYIQRRLIKGLEDLKVEYDMTVRNNKHKIVQFAYGEDGFDSTKIETQKIPIVDMNSDDIYMLYDIIGIHDERKGMSQIYTKGTITRMKKQREETKTECLNKINYMLRMRKILIESVFKYKNDNRVKVAVSFLHIIDNISNQLHLNGNSAVDITPLEAFELIDLYYEKINGLYYMEQNELLKVLYYYYLNPKTLLVMKRFHRKGLVLLLETIHMRYKESLVHPGEMVGVIAGQSIGEPTTQLTLNTFHLAGVASKSNVTRGVPRIEEILRLTKNPKSASLTIYMREHEQTDKKKAVSYSEMLNHTKLSDVVKRVQICFDANETDSVIQDDHHLMDQYYEFENMVQECLEEEESFEKSKWVIRIEIDAEKMLHRNITMDDINFAINSGYGNDVQCIYSDYNMNNLVFRIRLNSSILDNQKKKTQGSQFLLDQSDDIYLLRDFQEKLLNNIVLRGINKISNVNVRKVQKYMVQSENGYDPQDIYVLDTTGTNLLDTLALDYIDTTRTISNDIKEVFAVLGIEAARQMIHDEFVDVMEFSGVYINYHHLGLLCDRMTLTKNMVSIFRSGLLNDNVGPIAKSTFEVHTEVLLNASRHAEFDNIRGVSANVMLGQIGPFGTGMCKVLLDMKEMEKYENVEYKENKQKEEIEKAFGIKQDRNCSNTKLENNISSFKINTKDCVNTDDNYDMGL
jgi:DNA-directed RNA polymerase II subunit RPB1